MFLGLGHVITRQQIAPLGGISGRVLWGPAPRRPSSCLEAQPIWTSLPHALGNGGTLHERGGTVGGSLTSTTSEVRKKPHGPQNPDDVQARVLPVTGHHERPAIRGAGRGRVFEGPREGPHPRVPLKAGEISNARPRRDPGPGPGHSPVLPLLWPPETTRSSLSNLKRPWTSNWKPRAFSSGKSFCEIPLRPSPMSCWPWRVGFSFDAFGGVDRDLSRRKHRGHRPLTPRGLRGHGRTSFSSSPSPRYWVP